MRLLDRLLRRLSARRNERPDLEAWRRRHLPALAREVARVLPHVPERGAAIVDVGANLGEFTAQLLKARPDARAWLFEPVHDLYERCRDRFADNPRVVVEPFALAHENGSATIWKARHNPGGNSLVYDLMFDRRDVAEVTEKTVHDEERIEHRVFSEYAREKGIEHVDLIKTDTEGFDYRVLEGMLAFLQSCHPLPVILSELMEERYHPFWQDQLAVVQHLYALGYAEVDLSRMKKIDDILFVPA